MQPTHSGAVARVSNLADLSPGVVVAVLVWLMPPQYLVTEKQRDKLMKVFRRMASSRWLPRGSPRSHLFLLSFYYSL